MLRPAVHPKIIDAEIVSEDEEDVWRTRLRRRANWWRRNREKRRQRYDEGREGQAHGTRSIEPARPVT